MVALFHFIYIFTVKRVQLLLFVFLWEVGGKEMVAKPKRGKGKGGGQTEAEAQTDRQTDWDVKDKVRSTAIWHAGRGGLGENYRRGMMEERAREGEGLRMAVWVGVNGLPVIPAAPHRQPHSSRASRC